MIHAVHVSRRANSQRHQGQARHSAPRLARRRTRRSSVDSPPGGGSRGTSHTSITGSHSAAAPRAVAAGGGDEAYERMQVQTKEPRET